MTLVSTLHQLKSRSIHITTHPPPRSIIETKAVLAALQRFGEVVTFRNLKYDPTNTAPQKDKTAIAIFESGDAAQAAIHASPLQVPIIKRSSTTTDPHHSLSSSSNPHPEVSNPQHNQFTLNVFIKPARHNHEAAVRRNPFYTTFNRPDPECAIHKALVKAGIELHALADVPAARKGFLPVAQRERMQAWLERAGAGSLMGLWERGREGDLEERKETPDGDGGSVRRGDKEEVVRRDG
ncbi:hypothetical protein BJX63DRAFT_105157 [Aspergillus granulosus]|uniref:RRM domain-containing protein n=1 Tax=Aspergillus granulosus TaxID=176169 RepID=A0ABR4GU73_9EURO